MKLDKDGFSRVIAATPLVSIDLIVRNARGEVLLGYRRNRPAQNCWFVPGGRIRKNEASQDALRRIAQAELGVALDDGRLLGVFDHFYEDNYFGMAELSTHYVVIAMECELPAGSSLRADEQHDELRWWPVDALLASTEVHENSKRYFRDTRDNGFRCAARPR
ncbi:GDP-mannose mannosyl hydrolase [Noviherbaspirillum cavernae]|uniref:GDP-mannose mannosyl hydrolase n=1 Tax=Noviherbaspirillum cavernae TaxID=2320862 RepID=A0A418WWY7_9BURK|nr:GDP-mannose mannosyl hydrolase [Noviherbaspirillum cavernae]RJG04722.1 GDP-mannose mannosyl hydrolase [Noviherbaspirillum cavernae]